MSKQTPTIQGLARLTSQAAVGAAVVGAHRAWEAWFRLRKQLDPKHLAERLEALRNRVEDELAVASRF